MLDMQWIQHRMNNAGSQPPAQTPEPRGKLAGHVQAPSIRGSILTTLALGAVVGTGILKSFRQMKTKKNLFTMIPH